MQSFPGRRLLALSALVCRHCLSLRRRYQNLPAALMLLVLFLSGLAVCRLPFIIVLSLLLPLVVVEHCLNCLLIGGVLSGNV